MTNTQVDFIVNAINAAHDTQLTNAFFLQLGTDTLRYEAEFNQQAGFSDKDNELPKFFYDEPLAPSQYVARFHAEDVSQMFDGL